MKYWRDDDLLEVERFAAMRGLSSPDLQRLAFRYKLLCVTLGGQDFVPAFYLDDRLDLTQVERICRVLAKISPEGSRLFLLRPRGSLSGLTPLKALRRGHSQVRTATWAYAE